MKSRLGSQLLVGIALRPFEDVQLEPVVHVVETVCEIIGTLHGVVSQQVNPQVALRERAGLLVVNGHVQLDIEVFQVEGL